MTGDAATPRDDERPDRVWRVTTGAGHQLHAVEWVPADRRAVDVLLVHGLASNARLWDGVGRRLAVHGHRVVAYDQRGHGRSERAEDGFPWEGVVADLVDVVDALRLDRPVAVGQSWGGNVVIEAAARAAATVRSVVAVDGGAIDLQGSFDDVDDAWAALTPPSFDEMSYDELSDRMTARLDGWPPAALTGQLANMTRTPDGGVLPALRRDDHEQVVRALWQQRPVATITEAGVPVLLAMCDRGDDERRRPLVDAMVAAATSARVHWFLDADHDVHAQRPAEVVSLLREAIGDGLLDPA